MNRLPITAITAAAALGIAVGAFYLGRGPAGNSGAQATSAATTAASAPRQVLYWHDPMVPGQRFDKPGKSPFMDMELVPVYADDGDGSGSGAGIRISPQIQQGLGLRTAAVTRVEVGSFFDAVGSVQFDERLTVAVQARAPGWVEHLAVRAPMERVRQGQALATVFAPGWLGPLNELVALQRAGASSDLITAARERTRAMSIPPGLVRQAEEGATPRARYTLSAPANGVVAKGSGACGVWPVRCRPSWASMSWSLSAH